MLACSLLHLLSWSQSTAERKSYRNIDDDNWFISPRNEELHKGVLGLMPHDFKLCSCFSKKKKKKVNWRIVSTNTYDMTLATLASFDHQHGSSELTGDHSFFFLNWCTKTYIRKRRSQCHVLLSDSYQPVICRILVVSRVSVSDCAKTLLRPCESCWWTTSSLRRSGSNCFGFFTPRKQSSNVTPLRSRTTFTAFSITATFSPLPTCKQERRVYPGMQREVVKRDAPLRPTGVYSIHQSFSLELFMKALSPNRQEA